MNELILITSAELLQKVNLVSNYRAFQISLGAWQPGANLNDNESLFQT